MLEITDESWAASTAIATRFRISTLIFACAELGLIAPLIEGMTTEEAAERYGLDSLGCESFLDALAACKFLSKIGKQYKLSGEYRETIAAVNGFAVDDILAFKAENYEWLQMSAILRGSRQSCFSYGNELLQNQLLKYDAIRKAQETQIDQVCESLKEFIDRSSKVISVGDGHGYFSRVILERNSQIYVVVQDLEGAFESCKQLNQDFIKDGRLKMLVADARRFEHPDNYDLVFAYELLELFPREEKIAIIERALSALAPEGTAVFCKFSLSRDGCFPQSAALFSLRMCMKTSGAAYLETDEELAELIVYCGGTISSITRINQSKTLIVANKNCTHNNQFPQPNIHIPKIKGSAYYPAWRQLVNLVAQFRVSSVFFCALELSLFENIEEDDVTHEEIARRMGISLQRMRPFVNALCAIGVLQKNGDTIRVSESFSYLCRTENKSIRSSLEVFRVENSSWLEASEKLRKNSSALNDQRALMGISHGTNMFSYLHTVMLSNAPVVKALVKKIDREGREASSILDIGGGHGSQIAALLLAFPNLFGTLIDTPEAIGVCRTVQKKLIDSKKLVCYEGDARRIDIEEEFDIVMVNDLLHYFPHAEVEVIIRNAFDRVKVGGTLIVCEFRLDRRNLSPSSSVMFSFKAFLKTGCSRLMDESELLSLVQSCCGPGCEKHFLTPSHIMISARKALTDD